MFYFLKNKNILCSVTLDFGPTIGDVLNENTSTGIFFFFSVLQLHYQLYLDCLALCFVF